MMRQIAELTVQKGKGKFHVTSLKPVNPGNRADSWEAGKLKLFETGKKEAYEVVKDDSGERFRYISPLFVDAACQKCHRQQNYKIGDVIGGITVDLPVEALRAARSVTVKRSIVAYGITGITALLFIVTITWLLSKRFVSAVERELENERLRSAIQLAGAAAHELRQPMTTIIGFAELLNDKLSKGESPKQEIDIIAQQCYRMDEIIKKMVKITEYKTKTYAEDIEIFDLDIRSENTEDNTDNGSKN
ncbi:MAG: DUF3365 domain-containing protein [Nitrospirae bacterium]|nr:DUF3365 domain-containing protein [Nitrospirota bacterium]